MTPRFDHPEPTGSAWRGPLRALAIAALVVAAVAIPVWLLGGDDGVPPAATSTTVGGSETTVAPTTTTTAPTTTTSAGATPTTESVWEGEAFDLWVPVPDEGAVLGVVGVVFDDVLNLRTGPGASFDVVAELDPTADGIRGTGRGWQVPAGDVWWEVESDGVVGWANQRYLARLGDTTDLTATVVDYLGGIPTADTLEDLASQVAGARGGGSIVVVGPTEGDLGEITVDLVGFADDSVKGERLHVFASREGGVWGLVSVEQTVFCQRGVSDGICV